MNKQYRNAPISEVILGINYNIPILSNNDIYKIQTNIDDEYSNIQLLGPLPDEYLVENVLIREEMTPNGGHILYRFRTIDNKWLIQLQANKIYFNWIRPDDIQVGSYPGFTFIFNKFNEIIDLISSLIKVDLQKEVKYYDLTYHDRLEWEKYIIKLDDIEKILNLKLPNFSYRDEYSSMIMKMSMPIEKLGGHSGLEITSGLSAKKNKLLQFKNSLKGSIENQNFQDWFAEANKYQIRSFNELFTDEVRRKWE